LSNESDKKRRRDPRFAEEASKYEQPLPSREFILQELRERGVPLSFDEIAQALEVRAEEYEGFTRRLGAMERDGQLMRNRREAYLIPDKVDLIGGRIEGHADGFGFLVPDAGAGTKTGDIFLAPKEMHKALHGDRVMVRVTGVDRRGRPEGKIVEVLERANTRLVGRVFVEHGVSFVVAENRRISQDILIAPGGRKPKAGQVVMVELIEQPSRYAQPIGRIIEVLGDYAAPGMEIEIALRKHELPFEFSKEALAEARKLPEEVRKSDGKGREDLSALPLVTIDGETARDFDDAVYCAREGKDGKGGFRLVVAIADVSHYVQPGSALDRESGERGNSVYFPRRVIPMLPEKLSNGLCSINPQTNRLAMVCDMSIAADGEIKKYRFYPALIFSHARLTYTEVAQALFEPDSAAAEKLASLLPHLRNLDALYRVLAKARGERGAIDFETVETQIIFDEQGKIERIVPTTRNDAHRIIEECMLAANVCASDYLRAHKHPALYRIHEGPTPEKLTALREFLGEFGLDLGGGDEPHAKDYAKLLGKVRGRPDEQLLQTVMLRSLRQAVYSPDNVGHFGLAYESYTHFTSPIRRYPDLLVHRAIKAVLEGKKYTPGNWEDVGLRCSRTERRADEATRDVESWLKCYYMQDRIGEEFEGSVSSVTAFGIFVALDDVFIEGLVHISELGADYYHFDAARHQLLGERSGKRFRLSDRVKVQLVRVDLETNKIDFRLVEQTPAAPEKKKVVKKVAEAPIKSRKKK